MVQLSTSAFVAVIALSIPVSVLAGPINTIEDRDVLNGEIEELDARFDDASESILERGLEDHEELEARVLGHLWNGVRTAMTNGGARRVVTAPVRQAVQSTHKDNEAKKQFEAHRQAMEQVKKNLAAKAKPSNPQILNKWHDTLTQVRHQQLQAGKKTPREYDDELDAREDLEDVLEARYDWEIEDLD